MTLEEQVERFASKQWTATNTVGKNEIVVKFLPETLCNSCVASYLASRLSACANTATPTLYIPPTGRFRWLVFGVGKQA